MQLPDSQLADLNAYVSTVYWCLADYFSSQLKNLCKTKRCDKSWRNCDCDGVADDYGLV